MARIAWIDSAIPTNQLLLMDRRNRTAFMHKHEEGIEVDQLGLFEFAAKPGKLWGEQSSSTFTDNVSQPIHRWFRYSAGFSAVWVRQLIEKQRAEGRRRVFDPFAGSGTTLLEAEGAGVASVGTESHPFVARIARTKTLWREPVQVFTKHALGILEAARGKRPPIRRHSLLLQKCFPDETLSRLDSLRMAWQEQSDGSPASELSWLALVSIVRSCSPVGTAQWQYVLPNKKKSKVASVYPAFEGKVDSMSRDMEVRQLNASGPPARLYEADVRAFSDLPDGWADLIVTSPPYANNYDYADATRLEMTFMGDVDGWGDLQDAVRVHLVRSCTQHVAPISSTLSAMIDDPSLGPIRHALADVCSRLAVERQSHGGKKPYHVLVAAYFLDMAKVWMTLRRIAAPGALVCFVVGDSAPYGIHVPVERWLGDLATAAGFKSYRFEKTRERNTKWKNRKHRVPLQEGRLWVEG